MRNKILCTILAILLMLSASLNLPVLSRQTQAMDTLSETLTGTSPYTSSTYTHAEVFQGMNIYHGIDVSYHNGTIDWAKAAAAGVEYAFIRAGYRGYGNGSLQQDSKLTTYAPAAIAAGIPIGVYYFTEAMNETEAIEEANDCIRMIQENNIDVTLPIALDYEYQNNAAGQNVSRKKNLSIEAATANCNAFCKTIAAAGYTPIIYANSSDLVNLIDGASLAENYGIWLANYTTKTKYTGTYQIWQYSSKGAVDGISGNVDCNFWYTKDKLSINTQPKVKKVQPTAVSNLSSDSTSTKITLEWTGKANYSGYQIYRKKTYDGTYTKVKTITNPNETKWTNQNLAKEREYFYKVRAYAKNGSSTAYGPFTKLTAATISTTKAAIAKKSYAILKKPSANAKTLVTVPYKATIRYLGKSVFEDKSKFYHVQYKKGGKLYDGYLKSIKGLTFKKAMTTTAKIKLRAGAGTHTKALTTVPKNQTLVILGKKKKNGVTWYKTTYLKRRKAYTGYLSGDYMA